MCEGRILRHQMIEEGYMRASDGFQTSIRVIAAIRLSGERQGVNIVEDCRCMQGIVLVRMMPVST